MKNQVNKNKIWTIVLLITAVVFLVIGLLKLIQDVNYLMAATSLISCLVFGMIAWQTNKGKINFDLPNDGLKFFFPIGFVLTIVGGSGYLSAGIWGFGITLLVIALFFSPAKIERDNTEENAG